MTPPRTDELPDETRAATAATDPGAVAREIRALVDRAQLRELAQPCFDDLLGSIDQAVLGDALGDARQAPAARALLARDLGLMLAAHEPDVAAAARHRARLLHAADDAAGAAAAWLEAARLELVQQRREQAGDDLDAGWALLARAGSGCDAAVFDDAARLAATLARPYAASCWQAAAHAHEQAGRSDRAAHALHEAWWVSSDQHAEQLLEQAVTVASGRGWGARSAYVLAFLEDRMDDAGKHAQQALADARANGDRELEGAALHAVACARSVRGDLASAIVLQRQALAIARAVGDERTLDLGATNLVAMLQDDLRGDEALAELERIEAVRAVAGEPGGILEAAAIRALLLHGAGRVVQAREALADVDAYTLEQCEPLARAHASWIYLLIGIDAGLDDALLDSLTAALRSAAVTIGMGSLATRASIGDALRIAARGDAAAAAALLVELDVDAYDMFGAELALQLLRTGLAAGCAAAVDRAAELLARCDCTARTVGLARRELSAVRDCMQGIGNDSLVVVSEEWSRRGRPLDAARVLVAAAAAMRPGGDREQLARRAQTLLAGTGADAIQQQVTRLLRADRDEAARCALADAALFAGVDAAVREELLRHAVEVRRPAGSVLHEPDDALDALWIVRSGSVRLCRVTDDERRLTVELLDPGALLGEHALLGLPRAGTLAECEESVVLSVLPVARVSAASRRCPRLAENLLTLAGARMERSRQLAERVAFWTVDRRIARCLLDLELQYGRDTLDGHRIIERTFTHFQIAELVNARRETVGDFLKRMRGAGVLELRRRRIVLLDPAALQAIVDER